MTSVILRSLGLTVGTFFAGFALGAFINKQTHSQKEHGDNNRSVEKEDLIKDENLNDSKENDNS